MKTILLFISSYSFKSADKGESLGRSQGSYGLLGDTRSLVTLSHKHSLNEQAMGPVPYISECLNPHVSGKGPHLRPTEPLQVGHSPAGKQVVQMLCSWLSSSVTSLSFQLLSLIPPVWKWGGGGRQAWGWPYSTRAEVSWLCSLLARAGAHCTLMGTFTDAPLTPYWALFHGKWFSLKRRAHSLLCFCFCPLDLPGLRLRPPPWQDGCRTTLGQHFYHGFIRSLQVLLALICFLICT